MCVYIYIHTYVYIYIYTYVYVYTYIYNSVLWVPGFVDLRRLGRNIANLHAVPQIIRLFVKDAKKDK